MRAALLVNDNQSILERTARMLDEMGWDVHVATSQKSAMWISVARAPNLVIVDIDMHGGVGFETISRVRRGDKRAFIVAVTRGRDDAVPFRVASACGADHHVSGPVCPTKLSEAIDVGMRTGIIRPDPHGR